MRSRVTGPFGTSAAAPTLVSIAGPNPLPVSFLSTNDVQKTEFHDASVTNINVAGGAWVALGSGAALGAAIKKLQMSWTAGNPLEFGIGANAGAVTRKWVANQGEGPQNLDIQLAATDKLWVRSLNASGANSGYVTLNLMG